MRTIFEYASEDEPFDELPPEVQKTVKVADKAKDDRDAYVELRIDQLFFKAAAVLVELLEVPTDLSFDSPYDGHNLRLRAAAEIMKMRAVTLKSNKKRQTAEAVAKKLSDGFTFAGN